MQNLSRVIARFSSASLSKSASAIPVRNGIEAYQFSQSRLFSAASGGWGDGNDGDRGWGKPAAGIFDSPPSDSLGWDPVPPPPSWSGAKAGFRNGDDDGILNELQDEMQRGKKFVDGWKSRFEKTCELVKQAREPGVRGSYLKDKEKAEIYRLHKENPELFTIEKLAMDYGILRQRVHAIIFLKELEEEERKLGRPLDECIEKLLDNFPE